MLRSSFYLGEVLAEPHLTSKLVYYKMRLQGSLDVNHTCTGSLGVHKEA
jgi:hypothetical protein